MFNVFTSVVVSTNLEIYKKNTGHLHNQDTCLWSICILGPHYKLRIPQCHVTRETFLLFCMTVSMSPVCMTVSMSPNINYVLESKPHCLHSERGITFIEQFYFCCVHFECHFECHDYEVKFFTLAMP